MPLRVKHLCRCNGHGSARSVRGLRDEDRARLQKQKSKPELRVVIGVLGVLFVGAAGVRADPQVADPPLKKLNAGELYGASLSLGRAAEPPKRDFTPVELVGHASDFFLTRNWRAYYWREDFTFLLKEEGTGKTWRIISREPTPHYAWRLGTTYTGLKVDWKARPRVKVLGVAGVDRTPAEFYDYKLDDPNLATAFIVWVETAPDRWQEFYVNNWFHKWGDKADPVIYQAYAGKQAPYNMYGFLNGQTAPFSVKSRALIEQHPQARTFHGLIRATKDNQFGYEIEVLHLMGRDPQGRGAALYGDTKTLPPLDQKKPEK
jgi:hypothetical protein